MYITISKNTSIYLPVNRLPFQSVFEITVVMYFEFKKPNWPKLTFFMRPNFDWNEGNSPLLTCLCLSWEHDFLNMILIKQELPLVLLWLYLANLWLLESKNHNYSHVKYMLAEREACPQILLLIIWHDNPFPYDLHTYKREQIYRLAFVWLHEEEKKLF